MGRRRRRQVGGAEATAVLSRVAVSRRCRKCWPLKRTNRPKYRKGEKGRVTKGRFLRKVFVKVRERGETILIARHRRWPSWLSRILPISSHRLQPQAKPVAICVVGKGCRGRTRFRKARQEYRCKHHWRAAQSKKRH